MYGDDLEEYRVLCTWENIIKTVVIEMSVDVENWMEFNELTIFI